MGRRNLGATLHCSRIVADNEFVACQCTTTATHTGQYLDAAPTGKLVQLHEMMFNRIRDRLICETWAMVDNVGWCSVARLR